MNVSVQSYTCTMNSKHHINTEAYLMIEKSLKNRQLLTKFRICDHCLLIETGVRHKKISQQRFQMHFLQ